VTLPKPWDWSWSTHRIAVDQELTREQREIHAEALHVPCPTCAAVAGAACVFVNPRALLVVPRDGELPRRLPGFDGPDDDIRYTHERRRRMVIKAAVIVSIERATEDLIELIKAKAREVEVEAARARKKDEPS